MLKKLLLLTLMYVSSIHATMKLASPAFSHNEPIPLHYTCDGENISPALAWSDAPENTASFALIVEDSDLSEEVLPYPPKLSAKDGAKSDAEKKAWVHWIVFNIPMTVEHITKNRGGSGEEVAFLQGKTDFGTQKWGGPCPPRGTHRYHFTLYAIDTMIDLPSGATKDELLSAMQGHILEKATLIGTYQRKNNRFK